MDTTAALVDPVGSLLIWVTLAFLFWMVLTALVRPLRTHSILITASLSWIGARVLLWLLPTLLHHVEIWFGT